MEDCVMKTKMLIPVLGVLVLTSCTSAYMASTPYDDVYYVPGQPAPVKNSGGLDVAEGASWQSQVVKTDETVVNDVPDNRDFARQQDEYSEVDNQGYDEEGQSAQPMVSDYNYEYDNDYSDSDFQYSSRIKRFHRPMITVGYYDDFYTDYYWYTGDPWYSSYYFGPSFGMSMNWGWGTIGWGWGNPWNSWYSPWYSPWYGYGYGYGWGGGYWSGYNNGYWNGYWNGQWNGGQGSQWNDHHFYGSRGHRGSSNGAVSASGGRLISKDGTLSGRRTAASGGQSGVRLPDDPSNPSSGSLSQRRTAASNGNGTNQGNSSVIPDQGQSVSLEQRRNAASQRNDKTGVQDASGSRSHVGAETGTTVDPDLNRTRTSAEVERQRNAQQRYANPGNRSDNGYNYSKYRRTEGSSGTGSRPAGVTPQTRTYTAPAQNRTRTGDEYVNPAGRSSNSSPRNTNATQERRGYTPPATATPAQTRPQRTTTTRSGSSEYSAPTRTESYSTPARSSGSSSTGSYSAPSRSSSSPASSGSSSGGNSGSSSSGRRR